MPGKIPTLYDLKKTTVWFAAASIILFAHCGGRLPGEPYWLTLAHECGHYLFHNGPTDDEHEAALLDPSDPRSQFDPFNLMTPGWSLELPYVTRSQWQALFRHVTSYGKVW